MGAGAASGGSALGSGLSAPQTCALGAFLASPWPRGPASFFVLVGDTEACSLQSGTGLGVRLSAPAPTGRVLHTARERGPGGCRHSRQSEGVTGC